MNKQTDELEDLFFFYIEGAFLARAKAPDMTTDDEHRYLARTVKQAKTEILKHYISRDEVMGLLPQKRGDAVKQEEMIPFDSKYRVEMHWLRKCQNTGYNQAISDMRQALTTNEEE